MTTLKPWRESAIHAAHRVARTVFLASAPSSGGMHKGIRGVDRGRILLGCLQPGQPASTFTDALGRLCDRLHYLNTSGDKAADATRFWFDTRANLRREMEERKGRFDDRAEVRKRIEDLLKKLAVGTGMFGGVHVFTPSGDVPDDGALRLVFLPIDKTYTKQEPKAAEEEVRELVGKNGQKPRFRPERRSVRGLQARRRQRAARRHAAADRARGSGRVRGREEEDRAPARGARRIQWTDRGDWHPHDSPGGQGRRAQAWPRAG